MIAEIKDQRRLVFNLSNHQLFFFFDRLSRRSIGLAGFALKGGHAFGSRLTLSSSTTQWSFRKTGTMGTLASQAEIGVWVQAPGDASV